MKRNKLKIAFVHFKSIRGIIPLMLFVFVACNETKDPGLTDLGYDYYPIEIGQYRVYDVEEIVYNISGFDTIAYQLKETIFDSIVSDDLIQYIIKREIRSSEDEIWKSDSLWLVSREENYLFVTENNIPFIKLTFPVDEDGQWDGNSLNTQSEKEYYYQPLAESIIDSIAVTNHIRVIIEDIPENIVNQDERSEVYVRGIGLIEKNYLTLNFCTANCEELGEIESGRYLLQQLIETGNE